MSSSTLPEAISAQKMDNRVTPINNRTYSRVVALEARAHVKHVMKKPVQSKAAQLDWPP